MFEYTVDSKGFMSSHATEHSGIFSREKSYTFFLCSIRRGLYLCCFFNLDNVKENVGGTYMCINGF